MKNVKYENIITIGVRKELWGTLRKICRTRFKTTVIFERLKNENK